jgi:hypothetical protein
MKKILFALLLAPLIAWGQSYPSPTFNNSIVNGYESTPTRLEAASFGILPGCVDSTAGFTAMANYIATAPANTMINIYFPPGVYCASSITIGPNAISPPASVQAGATLRLIGAGSAQTVIQPLNNASAASVFFTVATQFSNVLLQGLTLNGNSSNTLQDGLYFYSTPAKSKTYGGINEAKFDDFLIQNFTGRQISMRGGGIYTGDQFPIQFFEWHNFNFTRPQSNHLPAFEVIGQFGQVRMNGQVNGTLIGSAISNGGPNIYIGADYRHEQLFVSAYDTSNYFVTATNAPAYATLPGIQYPSLAAVRVLGANLPTTSPQIALGTTYYLRKYGMTGASGVDTKFTLSTTRANAFAGTVITCSNQGTPANYYFVGLWADSLATANTITTTEPHRLITGDPLTIVGANIPTGLAALTTYYVIRVDNFNYQLASSSANAFAGTAITFTGGTAANFGFLYNGGAQSGLATPYSISGAILTTQNAEVGIQLESVSDAVLQLHAENEWRVIEQTGELGQLTILGGDFVNNAGVNGGSGGIGFFSGGNGGNGNVRVIGAPNLLTGDTFFYAYGGTRVTIDENSLYTSPAYNVSFTPSSYPTRMNVGTLTGSPTINLPAIIPPPGNRYIFMFNSGGAYTVSWNGGYKGATLTAASSNGQHATVVFEVDSGGSLVQISSTGWY